MAAPKAELSRLQRMMGQASPETTSGYVHYDVDEHRRIDPPAWRSACALSGRACGLSLTRRVVGKRVADSVGCLVGVAGLGERCGHLRDDLGAQLVAMLVHGHSSRPEAASWAMIEASKRITSPGDCDPPLKRLWGLNARRR